MTFTTFKLTELPLRTTLPLFSSSLTKPSFHHSLKITAFSTSSSLRTNKAHTSKTRPESNSPWTSRRSPATNSHSKPLQSDAGDPPRHLAGDRAQNAIERIVLRLRNLGLTSDDEEDADDDVDGGGDFTPMATGDERLADLLKREWIRPDTMLYGDRDGDGDDVSLPWEKEEAEGRVEEGGGGGGRRRAKAPTLAELTMEDEELRRLRRMGMYLRERISIPKAGLTKEVLQKIHDKWRKEELVRLKFHEVLARDMKTAHEIVERRTGGLVIWKAGSVMVVFRGTNYQGPPTSNSKPDSLFVPDVSSSTDTGNAMELSPEKIEPAVRKIERSSESLTEEEMEYNSMLDGLGPRFEEWWGTGVLPVDADLLPPKVPGYKTPFRLLPTGMRSRLTNAEMTNMRKLAKSLPCHFALGRNRNHQGLALAILKLWEKSSVVKIAVKRGIQNTNNKLMAEELKALTGGVLLLRNKYYIVMYRGKDFLPTSVAAVLAERQELTKKIQDVEENVRSGGVETAMQHEDEGKPLAGTLAEFYEAQARWGKDISAEEREKMIEEASKAKHARLVKRVEHKLAIAQAKKLRAERLLSKIEASMIPAGPDYDQETITDEERVMFRRVGLRMKAYLPLGIRGVFDGVIENMHLHWKHRELVKLISKQKTLAFVEDTARLLEYESGGILVAIERVPKGFALIYYRGKNYRRPINLRPRNLLTKAKALKRSVAMQRHEALSEHISELEGTIDQMKKEIGLPPEGIESNWSSGEDEDSNHVSAFAQSEDKASWLESIGEEEEEDDDDDDDDENGYENNDDDNYDEDSDWDSDEDFQISSFENNDRPLTKSG